MDLIPCKLDGEAFFDPNLLPSIALQFGRFINSLADRPSKGLYLGAALVSFMTSQGHVCLSLEQIEGKNFYDEYGRLICVCPPIESWKRDLLHSGVVGRAGGFSPLILDQDRLYLYRYWWYERSLARHLIQRAHMPLGVRGTGDLGKLLWRYFPRLASGQMDWQGLAAFVSRAKKLCIISGGPGTGKTTTVCKIISIALESEDSRDFTIALAAPTGKAAARLQEAMKQHKDNLPASREIKANIPIEASTIHRLLGSRRGSPYFLHNKDNPLAVDMVVIDEASMIDLPLMAKLFEAVPEEASIILLGDKDQLASVEAGAVLGDICADRMVRGFSRDFKRNFEEVTGVEMKALPAQGNDTGLSDCVVQLLDNYRFGSDSGIGRLAQAINDGDAKGVMEILKDPQFPDAQWHDLPSPRALVAELGPAVLNGYGSFVEERNWTDKFLLFEKFRILCAIKHGPYGVVNLNRLVERILGREGWALGRGALYPGLPLLVTRNDYDLGIFNGDIGIVIEVEEPNQGVSVLLRNADGSFRRISPSRLPDYEVAYTMSIHRAQGSEFDQVMIILPEVDVPILTRELIYTAVSRAKRGVKIWAKKEILQAAIRRRIQRFSGLREALQEFSKPSAQAWR